MGSKVNKYDLSGKFVVEFAPQYYLFEQYGVGCDG